MARRVEQLRFLLTLNGDADSPPASGMRDWLVDRGAQVTMIVHPLGEEERGAHSVLHYRDGQLRDERTRQLPSRPPATYPLDLLIPLHLPSADVVVAYNNMHAARAIVTRRKRTVVYSAVDFVPNRFGEGTALTRCYEALDRWACIHADMRFEVSKIALRSRDASLGLDSQSHPAHVVPIGAWLNRVPVAGQDAIADRRVVFIGHLVERMGIDTFIEATAILHRRGVPLSADIAGRGPLEEPLRRQAADAGLGEVIRWHGFISDHRELEGLLARACVALAPYSTRVESFTKFADPSKLKSYLAAGLPILLTDVPPNAAELAREAGAQVVADTPEAFADAIEATLADSVDWQRRHTAALDYVKRFDWDTIMSDAFAQIDIV